MPCSKLQGPNHLSFTPNNLKKCIILECTIFWSSSSLQPVDNSTHLSRPWDNSLTVINSSENRELATSFRHGRCLFPLVVVRFSGDTCYSKKLGLYGDCYSAKDCHRSKGAFGGFCAAALGVCCVFKTTCGGKVSHNHTYFQSRNFPTEFQPNRLEICTVDILRKSDNICQVKIDFLSTSLEGGDSNGICKVDAVLISGTPGSYGTVPPNICGPLANQSIYVDFGDSDKLSLSIITNGEASQNARSWNIKFTYIRCENAAPTGCLQYFTGAAGHVKILGYPQSPHLGELAYSVCIRAERGARSILWSRCSEEDEDTSFWLNEGPVSKGIKAIKNCPGDYVVILSTVSAIPTTDRYCGNSLSSISSKLGVTSFEKPFLLRVRTDGLETPSEDGNTGFCLQWRQNF
ncbi:unnamed protein product [Allacma fusca]|uniref:CUB domain-containing protein n=1 Tax=Allacma fusca TaxID=39272 RepID=A0A8J2NQB2_9HEXA|nr:unnamed protein product [Allacma fusca]